MRKLIPSLLLLCAIAAHSYAQNVGIGNTSPNSKLDVSGDLALREGTAITVAAGANSITLPTAKNSVYRLTGASGAFSITSISGGNDGMLLTLINATGQIMTVTNGTIQTNTGANLVGSTTVSTANLIYNATIGKWVVVSDEGFSNSTGWNLTGNSGTVPGTNFIGNTDNKTLEFRVNNTRSGFIDRPGGQSNTGFGYQTLNANTGSSNSAFGYGSLNVNTSGSNNTVMGQNAMSANTTGSTNTAIGTGALASNTTASYNTAVGWDAQTSGTTANNNVSVGHYTLHNDSTGTGNVVVGANAMPTNYNGSSNTVVGSNSGANNLGSGNIFLGYQAGSSETGSNKLYIANSNTATPLIYGDFNNKHVTVHDSLTAKYIQVSNGATSGYVLQSDASGNGAWVSPSSVSANNIYNSDGTLTGNRTVTMGADNLTLSATSGTLTFNSSTNNGNVAMGVNNVATGTGGAAAIGSNDTASGSSSFAAGINNKASGLYAIALGTNNKATSSNSIAVGANQNVSGAGGFAAGATNTASGTNSAVFGQDNTASGYSSFATGGLALASGQNAFSSGHNTTASGTNATAFGEYAVGSGANSVALGESVHAYSYGEVAVGQYNTSYSPTSTTAYAATDRVFDVGNGQSGANSDALTVLKNGNVGIGNSSPSYKLQVNGTTSTTNLQMTTGATSGYILQSDASGNGTWVSPASISANNIYNSDGTLTGARTVTIGSNNLSFVSSGAYILLDPTASGRTGIGTSSPISLFANTPTNILGSDGHGVVNNSLTWAVNDGGYAAAIYNADNSASSNGLAVQIAGTASNTRILDLSTAASQGTTGTTVMAVLGTGNVGIGTGSPQQMLSVNAGMNIDQAQGNTGTVSSNALTFGNSSGEGIASNRNAGVNQFGLDFYTDYNNQMSITNAGQVAVRNNLSVGSGYASSTPPGNGVIIQGSVGIGTTSPYGVFDEEGTNSAFHLYNFSGSGTVLAGEFHGNSSNGPLLRFSSGTGQYMDIGADGSGDFIINQGSTGVTIVTASQSTGYVGIGTTTPGSTLTVNGTTSTTNFQMTNGGTANYILQSDASGNGTWVSPSSISATNIYNSDGTLSGNRTVTQGGDNITFSSTSGNFNYTTTGNGSVAMGNNVTASGNNSFASGTNNTASGLQSFASGASNTVSGNYAFVTGNGNTAAGPYSMVSGEANHDFGTDNIVGGFENVVVTGYGHTIAIGYQDSIAGSAGAVFGVLNKVRNYEGFAQGDANNVSGQTAAAFGASNNASGDVSFVSGNNNTTGGRSSFAAGVNNTAASYAEAAIGLYGTSYTPSNTTGYAATDRVFDVGNGSSSSSPSDALTILKNGNVGIGNNSPTQTLQVNGTTSTTNFQMTNGGTANYILQSDASGNGTWVSPSAITANNIYNSDGTLTGNRTVTMGTDNLTLNSSSGNFSFTTSTGSIAMGNNVSSTGHTSVAMGSSTIAIGNSSVAMGSSTTAFGDFSTATGIGTYASGTNSTAMGFADTASGTGSTAIGYFTAASGINSTAMGINTDARSYAETDIGSFNSSYTPSSTSSWVATDRLFDIGNGISSSTRSDALVVLKNGNVGIGNNSPTKTLQVNGTTSTTNFQMTNGGTANYLLQSDASGNASWVAPSSITTGTSNTLTNTTNTITSTVNGIAATAPAVNSVANTSSGNTISTTVNGVVGTAVTVPNIYTADGTLTGARTMTMGGYALNLNGGTLTTNQDASINGLTAGIGAGGQPNNTVLGSLAMHNNTTGGYNTAIGYQSMLNNINGANNTAVGYGALTANSGGNSNTATGYDALYANVSGGSNTAVGYGSLAANVGANYNTGIGGYAITANVSGGSNAGLGFATLYKLTSGSNNTGTGFQALYSDLSGGNNVASGYQAGYNILGSGNVLLGYQAGYNETGSNKLYIANSSTATPLIYGDFSINHVTVHDSLTAKYLQVTNGATAGYLLQSDASGNASWVNPTSVTTATSVSNTISGNTISTTVNGTAGTAVTVPNIYTANGTLTGARTVTMGAYPLTFSSTGGGFGIALSGGATLSIGNSNVTGGTGSMAIGSSTTASGVAAITMGAGTTAPSFDEMAVGSFNTTYTPTSSTTWQTTDRIFGIGNGTSSSATSDALVVLKNGKIGAGVSTPESQLANTSTNIIGSDGNGVNTNSLTWAMSTNGYVGAFYNGSTLTNAMGLAIKGAGTASTNRLLDISTASAQTTQGTSVMAVFGNGTVGIGTTTPTGTLGFPNTGSNIAWGSGTNGPYTSIYDNANIHIWTDDVSNYESGQTGTNAVFNWNAGVSSTGTGGTTWMRLVNGLLGIGTGLTNPGNTLTVNGSGGFWNSNQVNFYTDAGVTNHGFVGEYGSGSDFSIAAVTSGNWMRIGANNANIAFFPDNTLTTGSTPKVVISSAGYIGVGTTSPAVPVDIQTSVAFNEGSYGWLNSAGNTSTASCTSCNVSLRATQRIMGVEFDATSDRRIKKNIEPISAQSALDMALALPLIHYQYIDQFSKGSATKAGFIAQEVEKVIPDAVVTSTDYIPSIYAPSASVLLNGHTLTVTTTKPHDLIVGDEIKMYDKTNKAIMVKVTAVTSPTEFSIDQWNEGAQDALFVYGKKVPDLHSVDFDQITAVAIGAVQEMNKKTQTLEQENTELKAMNEKLRQSMEQLKTSDSEQSNLIKTMKAQIDMINERLNITSNK